MSNIKDHLAFLSQETIDEKYSWKILLALKNYLSRACSSVRSPEIIQINHYVDECYAADKPANKNIVLSPCRVPFPIACFVNASLLMKDCCKLFFINKQEKIEIHPQEYIIPVFVALFSGEDSPRDSSFIGSAILCGELATSLLQAGRLSTHKSVCVAIVIVVGYVWNLPTKSIAHVLDKILDENHDFNLQTSLEAISVARFSPNWYLSDYLVSSATGDILAFLEHSIGDPNNKSFPGLDFLQFSIMGMSPLGTLLAQALYPYCDASSGHVSITIPSTVWGANKSLDNEHCSIRELEQFLSALITWKSSLDSDSREDLLRHSISEDQSDRVRITVKESSESSIILDINGQRISEPLGRIRLIEFPFDRILLPQITFDLHVVVGLYAAEAVLEAIDSLPIEKELTNALSHMYSRPGLD